MSSLNSLMGVTYSEFDNAVGPRLLHQFPEGVLSDKAFESISDYVIVGKHLCEKVIIINIDDVQVLNYSVAIENPKVCRNLSHLTHLTFISVWTKHTIICAWIYSASKFRHGS